MQIQENLESREKELSRAEQMADEQILRKSMLAHPLTEEERSYCERLLGHAGERTMQAAIVRFTYKSSRRNDTIHLQSVLYAVYQHAGSTYVIELSPTLFAILLIGGDTAKGKHLHQCGETLIELLKNDQEQLHVHISVGSPFSGIQGIAESYQSAAQVLKHISPFSHSCLLDVHQGSDASDYDIPEQVESKLTNLLLGCKCEKVHGLIGEIIGETQSRQLSTGALQRVLMELHLISAKALRLGKRSLNAAVTQQFTEFCLSVNECSQDEIEQNIHQFFDAVLNMFDEGTPTLSSKLFKTYIDEHFTQDISLQSMAIQYNTSAQYLSRLLRKELGMSFQSYVTGLRIARAKQLLVETDQSVTSIYESVGYVSRNTFIRLFKSVEGVTPSEYRNIRTGCCTEEVTARI